jgi:DNA-binding transcriptional MocR family regulator
MSLGIKLDRSATPALYRQIVDQVQDRICDGRLPAGARLPTVRQLASELHVTRLTVQNAYGELQNAGWIEATVGRGTFVSPGVRPQMLPSNPAQPLTPDAVINDILQFNQVVGLRSLASASPDSKLFPTEEFWQPWNELLEESAALVSYAASQGDPYLRLEVAAQLVDRGVEVTPDEVLVVAGATQGLCLVAQALAKPGDCVLVEQPTYLGLLHTLKSQGLQPIAVEMDAEGPIPDIIERLAVQRRPRFLCTVPTFQNPTGHVMSAQRRQTLLTLARRYGFAIVEDDIYARLAYDGPPPAALKALDDGETVIHISSFSKTLMPGLRLGYVVAPPSLYRQLLSLRRATDLCSPPLLQRLLARFLRNGGLKRHLRKVLPVYHERRDAALAALRHSMPLDVQWTEPQGGFCCWVTLPAHGAFDDLQQAALYRGWAFAPGEVFLAQPSPRYHLRICFGNQSVESLRTGIATLAALIRERLVAEPLPMPVNANWAPLV